MTKKIKEFIWRAPFAIFSAFGLLSISTGAGVTTIDDAILAWIEIWRGIVYPFWDVILYPIKYFFNIKFPRLFIDYISLGIISATMRHRTIKVSFLGKSNDLVNEVEKGIDDPNENFELFMNFIFQIFVILLWPISFAMNIYLLYIAKNPNKNWIGDLFGLRGLGIKMPDHPIFNDTRKEMGKVYVETLQWYVLVLAINYMLLYKNGELRFSF